MVVNGCGGYRRPGKPNGPPSPRLAPGGFYGSNTPSTGMRVREGWARASRAALLASEGMDAESKPASSERRAWMLAASVRETARAHPEPARGEPRPNGPPSPRLAPGGFYGKGSRYNRPITLEEPS